MPTATSRDLRVDCGGRPVDPRWPLMDVIELMGVPVHAWCTGRLAGPALGVLAVCRHRIGLTPRRASS